MIAIISALGFGMLLGGGYAIWDGWPYLVLERGFTQVILGAIAVSTGIGLLLASSVLRELRRMRGAITGMALVSAAGAGADAEVGRLDIPAKREPRLDPVRDAALAGAAAAAGITAVAAAAPTQGADSATPELLDIADEPPVAEELPPHADEGGRGDEVEPTLAVEPLPEEDRGEAEALPVTEMEIAAEPEAPAEQPVLDLAFDTADAEPEQLLSEPDIVADDHPQAVADVAPEVVEVPESEDFGSLRRHLRLGPGAVGIDRVEDELAAAGEWMSSPGEPLTAQSPPSPSVAEPVQASPAPSDSVMFDDEAVPSESNDARPGVESPSEADPLAADGVAEEPARADASPPPAASEEGVIGAYQVGDTQFTMYADGSIRARTPEGEYAFASMDELKAYLASEKSRLDP